MDIERLKEMKEVLNHSIFYFGRKSGKTKFADTWFDVMDLIDEAIARQSVTSEEVQRAINDVRDSLIHSETNGIYCEKPINQRTAKLAITALKQYQPKGE